MKACRARFCGLFPVLQERIQLTLKHWEATNRTFVGVDVSSRCTGLTAVRLKNGQVKCTHSVAIDMKRKAADDADQILHKRFDLLKQALSDLRKKDEALTQHWEISVEDKLVRVGGAKGVIGSHTLAEVIVAARIAAYQVFPEHVPAKVNPRSARAGLGLNIMGEGSGREETKANVSEFVKKTVPTFVWHNQPSDEDRADALILALSSLRSALKREMSRDDFVRESFWQCHGKDSENQGTSKSEARKLRASIFEKLDERLQPWIDELWLHHQFPRRV